MEYNFEWLQWNQTYISLDDSVGFGLQFYNVAPRTSLILI